MERGRLTITYTPEKGRPISFERSGTLIRVIDGAVAFLSRVIRRAV